MKTFAKMAVVILIIIVWGWGNCLGDVSTSLKSPQTVKSTESDKNYNVASNLLKIIKSALPDSLKLGQSGDEIRVSRRGMFGEFNHQCILIYKTNETKRVYVNWQCDAMLVILPSTYVHPDSKTEQRYAPFFVAQTADWMFYLLKGTLLKSKEFSGV